jgi:hypothetical protein
VTVTLDELNALIDDVTAVLSGERDGDDTPDHVRVGRGIGALNYYAERFAREARNAG